MITDISQRRRRVVVDALRRGAVPANGLDVLAVGLERFAPALDDDLDQVAGGSGAFKAIRGEYGAGKTFLTRWLAERAKQRGFASAEVQISELETPLHRMEKVYRRLVEHLGTEQFPPSALRPVLDNWIFALEEDVLGAGTTAEDDAAGLERAVTELLEQRLREVSRHTPAFAAALRGYRAATAAGDAAAADAVAAWLAGQPHVAASARRIAGVKGDLDHFAALSFLQGLLVVLRDSGHRGLLLVLDEVETLQRVRSDARDKALNALRQLIDDVSAGRFPGLYLVITGTPAFFDGNQGVQRLPPLAQRLATDFTGDPRWDNPRATQLRLPGFTIEALVDLGCRAREVYASPRVTEIVDDAVLGRLARSVTGRLGGQVGIAPRIYLKKLVAEVFDRVDQFPDWHPETHYTPTLRDDELTEVERNAAASADDVELPEQ
ncbi:ATP-binding protein [Asanoa ishikariensis]|uniref:BREX system ATP-binding protein BrxD n=1 Tax=Asanoa ishikariensis TaxID=137265 RepID=A0A1H3UWF6_9ACTN|nr:BREX system ATP-binding protein BrxD [Asanoa ishikariensis]GIF65221.1 ATP-binding protein [Asanoa ishikariensis]SDZ66678.1 P-loop protein of unknown function [Asanoa ishikariensis]